MSGYSKFYGLVNVVVRCGFIEKYLLLSNLRIFRIWFKNLDFKYKSSRVFIILVWGIEIFSCFK